MIFAGEQTFRTILDNLGICYQYDETIIKKCIDVHYSFVNNNTKVTRTPRHINPTYDEEMLMDDENWEEAKDIFFMLRIPFDVESTEESREKISKALIKRHRKRGRYGPQGGLSAT